ncbi:MAG TPA: hypothetical protein VEQ63_01065, partial [Bryobacteraceae bacterium]|nr:hypothetical protein [Bryobacteraceae bacterium]
MKSPREMKLAGWIAEGWMWIVGGILGVALVATLADYTWYTLHVRHNMVTGIMHGVVLLTAVGAVLGLHAGRLVKGLPIGALAGIGGALTYYLLVALVDRRTYGSAIPASWFALWLIVAVLDGRWLRAPERRPWRVIAIRGVLATVLSGAAFFMVMNTLWGRPPASGRNYAVQFGAWAVA